MDGTFAKANDTAAVGGDGLAVSSLSDDNTLAGGVTDGEYATNKVVAEGAASSDKEKAHTSDLAALDWEDSLDNPYNWSTGKKWAQVAMCSSFSLAT